MNFAKFLATLTLKNFFALLNSVQKFIETQDWLLLTFFISLHNQLSSFNSIIVQISEKRVHQTDSKNEWLLLSVTYGKT